MIYVYFNLNLVIKAVYLGMLKNWPKLVVNRKRSKPIRLASGSKCENARVISLSHHEFKRYLCNCLKNQRKTSVCINKCSNWKKIQRIRLQTIQTLQAVPFRSIELIEARQDWRANKLRRELGRGSFFPPFYQVPLGFLSSARPL